MYHASNCFSCRFQALSHIWERFYSSSLKCSALGSSNLMNSAEALLSFQFECWEPFWASNSICLKLNDGAVVGHFICVSLFRYSVIFLFRIQCFEDSLHSVNSKHGRHILQLIMTFITHHPPPQQLLWYTVAELLMQSHSTQALHQVVTASTDEDAQPVSLMYTHSHHMHEPPTDRPSLDPRPCWPSS